MTVLGSRKVGRYEAYSLRDASGWGIEVLPEFGARLNGLWLRDGPLCLNVIDGLDGEDEPHKSRPYYNVLLFPFVNRLASGRYSHGQRSYRFPINEPARDNALHGFLFDAPFRIVHARADADEVSLALSHDYAGDRIHYPFPFLIDVTYRVRRRRFTLELILRNTGPDAAPVAVGWHPYFTLGCPVDALRLQAPTAERIEVDEERLLPTGGVQADVAFVAGRQIGREHLDSCFVLSRDAPPMIRMESPEACLSVIPAESLGYLQLFTPPHRRSLAVEPMSANIDALNNGAGLTVLPSGARFSTSVEVSLDRI